MALDGLKRRIMGSVGLLKGKRKVDEETVKELSRSLRKALLEADFTLFAVRHGSSPKYKVPEMIEDLHRAVRFVRLHAREQGVDPDRLGITGASAGGHLSLLLGTTADGGNSKAKDKILRHSNRVAAIVAVCPPSDLREWAKPTS